MKTEQFDEIVRRKLLSLSDDTRPTADMEAQARQIQAYVAAHSSKLPSIGQWSRWAAYALLGGVLILSLAYNVVQYTTTNRLLALVDSLKVRQQIGSQATVKQKTDTVYVFLNPSPGSRANNIPSGVGVETGDFGLDTENSGVMPMPTRLSKQAQLQRLRASVAEEQSDSLRQLTIGDEQPEGARRQIVVDRTASTTQEPVRVDEPTEPNAVVDTPEANPTQPADRKGSEVVPVMRNQQRQAKKNRPQPSSSTFVDAHKRLTTNGSLNVQRETSPRSTPIFNLGVTDVGPDNPASTSGVVQVMLTLAPLEARWLDTTWHEPTWSMYVVKLPTWFRSQAASHTASAQPDQLARAKMVLNKGVYRLGLAGELTKQCGGGGALLGEVQLTPHWSLQAGLGVLQVSGQQFATSVDYRQRYGTEFDQDYRTGLPTGTELTDLKQHYTALYLPVAVGYYQRLGTVWGLRAGVGTAIDWRAQTQYEFEARGTPRADRGETISQRQRATPFNNLTMSVSAEYFWRKWLVRVGPVGSWQWQSVSYRPDGLSVGGQIQVFYQFTH